MPLSVLPSPVYKIVLKCSLGVTVAAGRLDVHNAKKPLGGV